MKIKDNFIKQNKVDNEMESQALKFVLLWRKGRICL